MSLLAIRVNGLAVVFGCGTLSFKKKECPMRQTLRSLLFATLMVSAAMMTGVAATPARADLVIEGRAAQALHCSAMLFLLSSELHDQGFISRNSRDTAQRAALVMLDFVPGTDEQRIRAMEQRFARIMNSRTPPQLFKEYDDTAKWCRKTFLK
ncbi:MAG: hypothetical protein K9G71_13680 [Rhodobacteraceae bacterium]|nr:hypothetical protein [Paracoccaceae bacterium]MCF8515497.1 hypothetical protein [Paracoccaceae bacterium]MCF8519742.1 hypothetical protein [Paracoccaceae bacterium]